MLAALLGALSLFTATPVQAQNTPVWSAMLTVAATSVDGLGCASPSPLCSSQLTDNSFTVGGTMYAFDQILDLTSSNQLFISFDTGKNSALQALVFCVGTTTFDFSDTTGLSDVWNVDVGWSVGDTVELSIGSSCPQPDHTLSVNASPPCGTTVTDTSVQPTRTLTLTPAPTGQTETQYRWVADTEGEWRRSLPIAGSGRSITPVPDVTFAGLRQSYPGFKGFEYRLMNDHSVTAECTWTFSETTDPVPPQPPPTDTPAPPTVIPPTGGGPSPGGGGSPPAEPSDPTPDSPRCGESDREDLERFYEATGGEDWLEKEYWNSQEPLDEWFGVKTDENGEVVSLRLADNNLSGDMPTEELLCLNENTELKELALWDNEDLSGEVPEELVWAVERAALRAIAEMLNLNPEWFEDYEDPFDFEDWHEGVTTDDEGRVTELDLPGEIPESIISQFKELREITITTSSDGGCALSPEGSSAFSLFLLTLVVFAVLGRKRAR